MPKTTSEEVPLTQKADLKLQDQPKKEEELLEQTGETKEIT